MDLLGSRGFDSVVLAGAATAAPRLLSRQTVVAGLSDGAVRVFEKDDARVRMQLPDATSPLPPLFLQSVVNLPLRQGPLHPIQTASSRAAEHAQVPVAFRSLQVSFTCL
jgi:hypothetical protein